MPDRKIANPLALAVLGLLFERPMHPYDMVTTLRQRDKHDSINIKYGSLYTVVRALVRENFIAGTETVRAGRYPERTIYAITDAGRREFHDWLADLLGTPQQEFPRFLAGLSLLPGLPPDEVADLLAARAAKLDEKIAQLAESFTTKPDDLWDIFLVENEYRIAVFTAEVEWIRGLVRRIRTDKLGGVAELRAFHRGIS